VVTQVPLHGIRLSQRELHQMNVPDVKGESQNASIRNDEGSASWSNRLRRRERAIGFNHFLGRKFERQARQTGCSTSSVCNLVLRRLQETKSKCAHTLHFRKISEWYTKKG